MRKTFLIGSIFSGLVIAIVLFVNNGKENLKQMETDFGLALFTGTFDVKAYHYKNGKLVDKTIIYENIEVVEDGTLFISEINRDTHRTFTIRVSLDERESSSSYKIEMNQELDWDGGGWLLGEVKREFVIDEEYPLVFQAAVEGRYRSVYKIIAEMREFTEFEAAFEGVDELVIFTITKRS